MILNVCCRFQRKLNFVFLLFICHILSTYGQGYFPKLVDLAELKPITSTSTCGATSSKYCQSSTTQTSLQTCFEETCKFDCCADCGSSKPVPSDLAERSNKFGVTQDGDPRNGTIIRSFRFQGDSYIQPLKVSTIDYVNPGFTISVWIKQKKGNKGTIISKDENIAPDYANVFQIVIQDYNLMFYYRPIIGNASVASYTLLQNQREKLQADEWHLITVAVINKGLSYYIDGELMNANVITLTGPILDSGGGVRIGQKYGGDADWQYEGLIQDVFIYDRALTNREAIEAFTGLLPFAYVASSCRCPPTHPKINVAEPAKCLKNLEGDLYTVSRLADTAHPIEFATDGDTLSFWLSEITNNVTIDINLSYSGLQVFYIVLTFYGPVPGGLEILRSTDNGRTFHPWQYFAEDCVSSFGLQNNGPLTQPDSVNCVQYVKPLQSSREVLTFQTEYPPPPGSNIPVRPFVQNCSSLYCSESLLQFLKATHVKFRFHNHTLVQNAQHKYYGLERVLVTGRCECFGHASSISYVEGNSTHPGHCVCDCHSSTNTEGETCNRCKPLYNNKPFQRGDQDDSYPCVKCECNEHASSCVYNQSLDTSLNSRTQGGGGVCIDCQHNTTGRFCEECKERFYRESGKSLKASDVCSPCGCEGPGVQSGKLDCVKNDSDSNVLAGQCECRANARGRQCDVCEEGYFDLKASHATGCVACGCVLDGAKNRSISCHATSGQCDCKDRVTGTKCDICMPGFWGLSGVEPLGCKKCDCDPFGTTAGNVNTCDAVSGQCSCKPASIGRKCDQCEDGYHSTQDGCSTCNCSAAGTQPSFLDRCDKNTGRCTCKLNVEGNNCDQCTQGFYNLSPSNPQGCTQCTCDTKGTVGGSGQCEQQSGNCTCKPLVIGQSCNQCMLGTYGLNQSNPNGCQPCNCFPKGTRDGDTKRTDELQCSSNGQCFCLSTVSGLRCDSCVAEFYWNSKGQGCVHCNCNLAGSVGRNCNDTGQCTCKANITGGQCNKCVDGYYGFNVTGSCTSCNCNPAGSRTTNKCNERGECACKDNVEGVKCDQCKNGTTNLQQNNKYGCSGVSDKEPPTDPLSNAKIAALAVGLLLAVLIVICITAIKVNRNVSMTDPWEVDGNLVTLGEELGKGAFGKVYKGVIKELNTPSQKMFMTSPINAIRKNTVNQTGGFTVAVKMLNGMADNDQRRKFLTEIKFMKDMGSQDNILNMLGCCTVREPMFLLVEYAPYGDLLHYLRRRRTKVTENNAIYVHREARKANNGNISILSLTAHSSEAAEGNGIDNKGMSKEDEANDQKDESEETLSPKDVIAFAWQISRGMEYLTRKGLVHGDLAARNVLVGDNKITKVAYFGLTRHVNKEKRSRELPFKWMSIEAISDQKFTTENDVWAFGILLWELVTLGGTPYPTKNKRELLRLLKGGYRMERPDTCNQEMFSMITDCWMENPDDRPNFTRIRERLEGMMQKGNPYLDFSLLDESRDYYNVPSFNSLERESSEDELFEANSDEILKNGSDGKSLGGLERKTSEEPYKDETGSLLSSKEGPEMDKDDGPVDVNKIDFNKSLRGDDAHDRKGRDKNIEALEMA